MSIRYRVIHVNAARTEELYRYNFDFPETTKNNVSGGTGGPRYNSAEAFCARIAENVSGFVDCPTSIPLIVGSDEDYGIFRTLGFETCIPISNFHQGDRLYIDRWDNKHSYIEIASVSSSSISLKYCCADGTVYLNNIGISISSSASYTAAGCLPFIGIYEPWTANDIRPFTVSPSYYYGTNPGFIGSVAQVSGQTTAEIAAKFWNAALPLDGNNPYAFGGTTTKRGGDPKRQNWDNKSDIVLADGMPTKGAVDTGMATIFSPSKTELSVLSEALFSSDFFEFVLNSVSNISELFVSLGVVPFEVTKGSVMQVTWFGFDFVTAWGRAVTLTKAANQYYEFNMGTINFGNDDRIHTTDSVFDYSPFSTLGIYLPFIGFEELDIDEFRGNSVSLTYRIDILSGTCVALLTIEGRTIYQFTGNCLTQIPLVSQDMSSILANSVNIGIAAASAGASSAVAGAGIDLAQSQLNAAPKDASAGIVGGTTRFANARFKSQVSSANGSLVSSTANAMMGMKPNFKHSGAIGASSSLFAVKQPYFFLKTPNEAVPDYYENYCGFPSNITSRLGDLHGYTVVEDIRLNGLVATSPEVDEIYKLLKEGVII